MARHGMPEPVATFLPAQGPRTRPVIVWTAAMVTALTLAKLDAWSTFSSIDRQANWDVRHRCRIKPKPLVVCAFYDLICYLWRQVSVWP